jgi:predicted transcriptional regulator
MRTITRWAVLIVVFSTISWAQTPVLAPEPELEQSFQAMEEAFDRYVLISKDIEAELLVASPKKLIPRIRDARIAAAEFHDSKKEHYSRLVNRMRELTAELVGVSASGVSPRWEEATNTRLQTLMEDSRQLTTLLEKAADGEAQAAGRVFVRQQEQTARVLRDQLQEQLENIRKLQATEDSYTEALRAIVKSAERARSIIESTVELTEADASLDLQYWTLLEDMVIRRAASSAADVTEGDKR